MEEIFSSDDRHRQLLTGVGDQVTPFPEPELSTAGLLYHHQATALIAPPPPQKLRPVRSNGRRTIDASRINGSDSPELGFLSSHQDLGQILAGNHSQPAFEDDSTSPLALVKMTSQMDANFISTINSQFSQLPSSFSCNSSGDSADEAAGPSVYPKKRKKLESFLEDLLRKVMEKQEQMHQQLIEMIEKKERERIMREEAWRQQEMERAQKALDVRSQEAARNLALLSFIQNALGQETIQMPQPLPVVLSADDDAETDPNNKRWPTSEVQALITLRTSLDHKFCIVGPKTPVWEHVSAEMANMGYNRNAKKCKEKWENINKYFKKATGNGKKRSENAKSCPYFHELETLYRSQLTNTTKPNSPSSDELEFRSGKE